MDPVYKIYYYCHAVETLQMEQDLRFCVIGFGGTEKVAWGIPVAEPRSQS